MSSVLAADYDVGPGPLVALWRFRQVSAVIIALAVLAGALRGVLDGPPTKAIARMGLASPRGFTVIFGGSPSGADLGRYANARARYAESTDVLTTAVGRLGDGTLLDDLRDAIEVTASTDSDVLTVTAVGSSLGQAQGRADAVVAAYQDRTRQATITTVNSQLTEVIRAQGELSRQLAEGTLDSARVGAATTALAQLQETATRAQTEAAVFGGGTVFAERAVPREQLGVSSRARDGALVGLPVGVLIAGAVAWTLSRRRREIDDGGAAAQLLGVRLLGEVSSVGRAARDSVDSPARSPLPGYHGAAGVLTAIAGNGLFVLVSPARGDGRTATALGLAGALAASGRRVALVDGDLRAGQLTRQFGLRSTSDGLAQLARGTATLTDVVRTYAAADGGEISFIPHGTVTGDVAGLLRRPNLTRTMGRLKKSYDVVLVDTPAIGAADDAFLLAATATGIIAVARWRTPARPLLRLRSRAEATAIPLVGAVLTRGRRARGGYRNNSELGLGGNEPPPEPTDDQDARLLARQALMAVALTGARTGTRAGARTGTGTRAGARTGAMPVAGAA